MMKKDCLLNMQKQEVIFERIKQLNYRSAWDSGVVKYAMELVHNVGFGEEITEKNLLSGAKDWKQYSEGGCSLIYDIDICHRLCTPSEIKKTKDGGHRPNKNETWIDVQARALYQAARLIMKIKRKVEK